MAPSHCWRRAALPPALALALALRRCSSLSSSFLNGIISEAPTLPSSRLHYLASSCSDYRLRNESPWLMWWSRYMRVTGSEVRVGNIIERKGSMQQVVKTQHTQHGRGGALIQVELRDVKTGVKSTERLRTNEAIEVVFVDEKAADFLYKDNNLVVLMDPKTFEQMTVSVELFGSSAAYLTDGMQVSVQLFNGEPLAASLPEKLTCRVAEAEPYFKGQTATPVFKKARLENGLTIQVPGFVQAGDEIVIQTSDNSYVTRARE